MSWNQHDSHNQHDSQLDRIVDGRRRFGQRIFREIFLLGCWALWRHHNEVIFDNVPVSLTRWKVIFIEEFRHLLFRAKSTLGVELESWFCNFL
jgi:hypothetical protein